MRLLGEGPHPCHTTMRHHRLPDIHEVGYLAKPPAQSSGTPVTDLFCSLPKPCYVSWGILEVYFLSTLTCQDAR